MTIEIRTVRDDELTTFLDTALSGFLERRDTAPIAEDVRAFWELPRTWAAFDGQRMCGTLRSWATEITVPGGATVAAAAVAGVAVLPTHRRRGILRALAAAEHAAARERGEALSLLYASEYPIYGRLGYGVGCRQATWELDSHATSFHDGPVTDVDLISPDEAARDALRDLFDARRRRQVGEIRRRDVSWDFDLALRPSHWGDDWKGFLAVHRATDGTVDGYVRYTPEGHWERRQPRTTIVVDELLTLTDAAEASLWRFLAETDWVALVRAPRRSPADPLPWRLTNARAASLLDVGDGLWVRLLDVRAALAARTYDVAGSVVLEVVDPEAPGGRARVALDAGPDGATCTATRRTADLTVDVAALGAAYLGGTRLRDAVRARGVDEHRSGALAGADRLLRTADEPWCSTFF